MARQLGSTTRSRPTHTSSQPPQGLLAPPLQLLQTVAGGRLSGVGLGHRGPCSTATSDVQACHDGVQRRSWGGLAIRATQFDVAMT